MANEGQAPVSPPEHKMAEKQECRNCKYFRTVEGFPDSGHCYAHAPVRVPNEPDGWPNTRAHLWCGEWAAIEETKK